MERPNLTNIPKPVVDYIEYLETLIGQIKSTKTTITTADSLNFDALPLKPESPTTIQIISVSRLGFAKRTARHHYLPQHRGGTGNPDFQVDSVDAHAFLAVTNNSATVLALTNKGRVFRIPFSRLEEKGLREPGSWLWERIELDNDEQVACLLPVQATGFIVMVTRYGRIRVLRHHLFGEHMRPGMGVFSTQEHGELATACWTPGDADILVSTRNGMAIRFNEKIIPPPGDQAIRLSDGDEISGLAPVYSESDVFIATADGRGALRKMSGFAPNKSMGGSGKILIKSNHVIGIASIRPDDHIFLLTQQGKVIRFPVDEVPLTDAPVQGVNCMTLRGDEVISMINSGLIA